MEALEEIAADNEYLNKSRHLLENQVPLQLVLGVETLRVFFNLVR